MRQENGCREISQKAIKMVQVLFLSNDLLLKKKNPILQMCRWSKDICFFKFKLIYFKLLVPFNLSLA